MEKLVHQNAHGLHFGQRIFLSDLEMLIEDRKALIDPEQAQAGEVESRSKAGSALVRHRSGTPLLSS